MSDAFGFSSAEFETVDDAGDLAPYDFSDQRKARYDGLPADIKECLEVVREDFEFIHLVTRECPDLDESEAGHWQLLDYLGAL